MIPLPIASSPSNAKSSTTSSLLPVKSSLDGTHCGYSSSASVTSCSIGSTTAMSLSTSNLSTSLASSTLQKSKTSSAAALSSVASANSPSTVGQPSLPSISSVAMLTSAPLSPSSTLASTSFTSSLSLSSYVSSSSPNSFPSVSTTSPSATSACKPTGGKSSSSSSSLSRSRRNKQQFHHFPSDSSNSNSTPTCSMMATGNKFGGENTNEPSKSSNDGKDKSVNLYKMKGLTWKTFLDEHVAMSELNSSDEEDDRFKKRSKGTVMRLDKSDMGLYGLYPESDPFYAVICDICNAVVKPQGLQKHMATRHHNNHSQYGSHRQQSPDQPSSSSRQTFGGDNKDLLMNENNSNPVSVSAASSTIGDGTQASSNSNDATPSSCTSGNVSSLTTSSGNSKSKSKSTGKFRSKNGKSSSSSSSSSNSSAATSSQILGASNAYTANSSVSQGAIDPSKDVPNTVVGSSTGSSKTSSSSKQASNSSSTSSQSTHRTQHTSSSKKTAHDEVSSTVSELSFSNIINPNATSPQSSRRTYGRTPTSSSQDRRGTSTRNREYEPDKHCGVITGDQSRPCTRSLTCKSHSLSMRRMVTGRSKSFDKLLSEHRANKETTDVSTSNVTNKIIPELESSNSSSSIELDRKSLQSVSSNSNLSVEAQPQSSSSSSSLASSSSVPFTSRRMSEQTVSTFPMTTVTETIETVTLEEGSNIQLTITPDGQTTLSAAKSSNLANKNSNKNNANTSDKNKNSKNSRNSDNNNSNYGNSSGSSTSGRNNSATGSGNAGGSAGSGSNTSNNYSKNSSSGSRSRDGDSGNTGDSTDNNTSGRTNTTGIRSRAGDYDNSNEIGDGNSSSSMNRALPYNSLNSRNNSNQNYPSTSSGNSRSGTRETQIITRVIETENDDEIPADLLDDSKFATNIFSPESTVLKGPIRLLIDDELNSAKKSRLENQVDISTLSEEKQMQVMIQRKVAKKNQLLFRDPSRPSLSAITVPPAAQIVAQAFAEENPNATLTDAEFVVDPETSLLSVSVSGTLSPDNLQLNWSQINQGFLENTIVQALSPYGLTLNENGHYSIREPQPLIQNLNEDSFQIHNLPPLTEEEYNRMRPEFINGMPKPSTIVIPGIKTEAEEAMSETTPQIDSSRLQIGEPTHKIKTEIKEEPFEDGEILKVLQTNLSDDMKTKIEADDLSLNPLFGLPAFTERRDIPLIEAMNITAIEAININTPEQLNQKVPEQINIATAVANAEPIVTTAEFEDSFSTLDDSDLGLLDSISLSNSTSSSPTASNKISTHRSDSSSRTSSSSQRLEKENTHDRDVYNDYYYYNYYRDDPFRDVRHWYNNSPKPIYVNQFGIIKIPSGSFFKKTFLRTRKINSVVYSTPYNLRNSKNSPIVKKEKQFENSRLDSSFVSSSHAEVVADQVKYGSKATNRNLAKSRPQKRLMGQNLNNAAKRQNSLISVSAQDAINPFFRPNNNSLLGKVKLHKRNIVLQNYIYSRQSPTTRSRSKFPIELLNGNKVLNKLQRELLSICKTLSISASENKPTVDPPQNNQQPNSFTNTNHSNVIANNGNNINNSINAINTNGILNDHSALVNHVNHDNHGFNNLNSILNNNFQTNGTNFNFHFNNIDYSYQNHDTNNNNAYENFNNTENFNHIDSNNNQHIENHNAVNNNNEINNHNYNHIGNENNFLRNNFINTNNLNLSNRNAIENDVDSTNNHFDVNSALLNNFTNNGHYVNRHFPPAHSNFNAVANDVTNMNSIGTDQLNNHVGASTDVTDGIVNSILNDSSSDNGNGTDSENDKEKSYSNLGGNINSGQHRKNNRDDDDEGNNGTGNPSNSSSASTYSISVNNSTNKTKTNNSDNKTGGRSKGDEKNNSAYIRENDIHATSSNSDDFDSLNSLLNNLSPDITDKKDLTMSIDPNACAITINPIDNFSRYTNPAGILQSASFNALLPKNALGPYSISRNYGDYN